MKRKTTNKEPIPIKRRVELDVLRLEGQIQSLKERLGFTDWRKVLMLAVCIEGATDRLIRDLVTFETFHLNLTERAYDEVVTRIADSDTIKELRNFNQTLKYGAQLLRATARSIQNEVPKTLERSFSVSWHPQLFQEALKKSVDNNPWWQHLDVILAEIEKHKETFLPKMQDLAKQK
ncbi:MAG: hypothetical protein IPI26_00125 [Elusimicrobia bacterium]|nr:hypothetical protein [Elusimicrobiota bacterium]